MRCVYLSWQIVSETDGVRASLRLLLGSFETGRMRKASRDWLDLVTRPDGLLHAQKKPNALGRPKSRRDAYRPSRAILRRPRPLSASTDSNRLHTSSNAGRKRAPATFTDESFRSACMKDDATRKDDVTRKVEKQSSEPSLGEVGDDSQVIEKPSTEEKTAVPFDGRTMTKTFRFI